MAIYLLLLPLIIIIVIFTTTSKTQPPSPPLPPGPKPWPIIGNLLHLTKNYHISLESLSKLYGPLVTLRLGSQLMIVASSPAAATEILKTHDRLLSGRFLPKVFPWDGPTMDRKAIIWASSCHNNWKSLKTVFKTRLFSSKAMECQSAVRERKAAEMVELVRTKVGEEIYVGKVVSKTVLSSLFNLMFSRECVGFEESLVRKLMELIAAPNVVDVFPILDKLDLQGLRRAFFNNADKLSSVWRPYVNERREILRRGGRVAATADRTEDFLDVFLEIGLDDEQIDWLCHEIAGAGTDTTTTIVEWAMAELMKNKGTMNKLREELKTEFSSGKPLKESDIYHLPYFVKWC